MTLYNTIKDILKGTTTGIATGIAALAIGLSSGCAPRQAVAPRISPEESNPPLPVATPPSAKSEIPMTEIAEVNTGKRERNGYVGLRVGGIWPLDATETDYNGSATYGLETGVERRNFGVRVTCEHFNSSSNGTENGADYSIKNKSTLTGADFVCTVRNSSPLAPKVFGGISYLHEYTKYTIGAPYNVSEKDSNGDVGYRIGFGLERRSNKMRAALEASYTGFPKSDNAKGTGQITLSVSGTF